MGDLAVADTSRTEAGERLTAAAVEGQALVQAAQNQAAQLLTDAQAALDDTNSTYATAYHAALDAGWQPGELTTLGYPAPAGRRPRRRGTAAPPRAPTPPDLPIPRSHPDHDPTPSPSSGQLPAGT